MVDYRNDLRYDRLKFEVNINGFACAVSIHEHHHVYNELASVVNRSADDYVSS
jgi:hypothetical protein